MKRTLFIPAVSLLALLLTLGSCGKNSKEYKDLQAQYDSLLLANQGLETANSESEALVAEVMDNFNQITALEGSINLETQEGNLQENQKAKIEDNFRLIREKLQKNKETIDNLSKKVNASGKKNSSLAATVESLRKQLTETTDRLAKLEEQLRQKDIVIEEQAVQIGNLQERTTNLEESNAQKEAQINNLYQVRYCIGTKHDLKDMGVLKNGKVAAENYNAGYFTTIDRREVTSIALYDKKAKLLTNHPSGSYTLEPDAQKRLTLKITNQEEFWKHSKVLIVQVG